MSVEENKALVRRFFEAQAKGDLDAVREMMAPDFVDHSLLPGQTPGREGYLQSYQVLLNSIGFIMLPSATSGSGYRNG